MWSVSSQAGDPDLNKVISKGSTILFENVVVTEAGPISALIFFDMP